MFRPARGIHTHFMRFAIDLVYLDDAQHVCAIREALPPWRLDLRIAPAVIEASAGAAKAADIRIGDLLLIDHDHGHAILERCHLPRPGAAARPPGSVTLPDPE